MVEGAARRRRTRRECSAWASARHSPIRLSAGGGRVNAAVVWSPRRSPELRVELAVVAESRRFSARTALATVVANMIGTGVFTSLGFQLLDIQSGFVILALWLIGGVAALCGALAYAELGAALPRSGGEYNFLTEIYHPAAGFVSGWISATIGFAAPTALAAMTFGAYLESVFPVLSPTWLALGVVAALAGIHATTRRLSGGAQRALTVVKVGLIVAFCGLGVVVGGRTGAHAVSRRSPATGRSLPPARSRSRSFS